MTAKEMREMAAKKAEEWIIPDERLELVGRARHIAGTSQNYTAEEIAKAIRALPLEAEQVSSALDEVIINFSRATTQTEISSESRNAAIKVVFDYLAEQRRFGPAQRPDLIERARQYLRYNAAESGADVLIGELADALECTPAQRPNRPHCHDCGERLYCHHCGAAAVPSTDRPFFDAMDACCPGGCLFSPCRAAPVTSPHRTEDEP